MLTRSRPAPDRLAAMVRRHATTPLNVEAGLLHRAGQTRGWFVDRHDESVGHGADDFLAACDALRHWAQFRRAWLVPAEPPAPIEVGTTVGYSARALGLWWSYCCRIGAVIDGTDADGTRRYGFDYTTLRGHAERGEERFQVTMGPDGDVRFSLFALSRPGRWFIWFGLPLARRAQARFRTDATAAVRDAVGAASVGRTG